MPGTLIRPRRYNRLDAKTHPDWLYVFGDNMARTGYGGQAAEMRGEPNAVGIPTKLTPGRDEGAYLTDKDLLFKGVGDAITDAFSELEQHLRRGGTVVFPADGVGTGLAELPTRAPLIDRYITYRVKRLEAIVAGDEPLPGDAPNQP